MKVIYEQDGGVVILHPAKNSGLTIEQIAEKDVPPGYAYQIVQDDALRGDRAFRNAWRLAGSEVITDLSVAQEIAHELRRTARDSEFLPLDRLATIQSETAKVETQRQTIRDKYAAIQTDIDAAATEAELKAIIEGFA